MTIDEMIRAALLRYLREELLIDAHEVTDWTHEQRWEPSDCGCCAGTSYYALVISFIREPGQLLWEEWEIRGDLEDIFKSIEV